MGVMHVPHEAGFDRLLFDDCARCDYQAMNLEELDELSLYGLTMLARSLKDGTLRRSELSDNEIIAVEQLRLMGRIVFKAKMTEEIAR